MTDDASGPPALRASDADREHAAEALRTAAGEGRLTVDELDDRLNQAFAARTHVELDALVADIVPPAGSRTRAGGGRVPVRGGEGGSRWLVSILGGTDRSGRWRLGASATNINFWGGSDLDLNDVELTAPHTTLRVIAIMGGADLHLPENLNVEVSQVAILGGNDIRLGEHRPDPGGPTLHLKLFALMGGSNVQRGRKVPRRSRRGGRDHDHDQGRGHELRPPEPPELRPPGRG